MRQISVDKLTDFITTKYENSTDEDVFPYNEELITVNAPAPAALSIDHARFLAVEPMRPRA